MLLRSPERMETPPFNLPPAVLGGGGGGEGWSVRAVWR